MFRSFLLIIACAGLLGMPALSQAQNALPEFQQAQLKTSLHQIGTGTYRKFGFSVYRATLWAAEDKWNANAPYALQLRYTRDVSQDTLVDTVMDDIESQGVADTATLARWKKKLQDVLPDIADGDSMVGVAIPGKKSLLFHNGREIASIDEAALSEAFFNIWLGDGADENLRASLLGRKG